MIREVSSDFWKDKRVLVTGHAGFKGGWLSLWLSMMKARVYGIALDPSTQPNFYTLADIEHTVVSDMRIDIRERDRLVKYVQGLQPEIVFHLAAQPLVHAAYKDPIYTMETNILGTAHVLEAIRHTSSVKVAVMITTDKVYENKEWVHPYREVDPLGGNDPYSSSKACAEILISSYRKSYLSKQNKSISSARAGNVIGGGDWSADRLLPDAMKAFLERAPLTLRNPNSTRPWQYVLEPLAGYLILAEAQYNFPNGFAKAWNFAPYMDLETTVWEMSKMLGSLWGSDAVIKIKTDSELPAESALLNLDSSLARMNLGWRQKYTLLQSLRNTVEWYKAFRDKQNMKHFSIEQIKKYMRGES